MAEQPFKVYTVGQQNIEKAAINLLSDTIVCTLHTTSYTPNNNTHGTWADVSATELSTGSGYTAGGVALTTKAVTAGTATVTFDCDDISWASFSGTFRYAIFTRRAGGSLVSGDLLIGYYDLTGSGNTTGGGGTLMITINASGVFVTTIS